MSGLKLWDLAGEDPARRFSPYCWRTRMALVHKGLAVETLPWRFTDRAAIAPHTKVPVLEHPGGSLSDSWAIAEWLEESYPARPSLFRGEGGRALSLFVNSFADAMLMGPIARLIVADIPAVLVEHDRAYFHESREARFGMPLAQVSADRETAVVAFRQSLLPLRLVLRQRDWLGGVTPAYADHIVFGCFQWARCVSPFALLAKDDPLYDWRERMLDAYGGLARAVPAFAEA
ncbi:glutathione S-transferase [Humitalea rosea]|uniref:Glutathione S-transferase n=1 Tax=Humitalea rosea TaxID=990373 RepID=A0A2W7I7R9_9PROT|nr:glutathione S-transferase family protein [Humitalea rosea]PZW42309.1 glutathione S-transferase [Humitalea rosea]